MLDRGIKAQPGFVVGCATAAVTLTRMDSLASIRDWLLSLSWQSLLGPFIAILALLFTVGSFWWLQARQGRLRSYQPHTFALTNTSNQALFRFPLVFYNTGPKPIVIRDMKLLFPKQPVVPALAWLNTRSQLKPAPDDGHQFPAVFSVPGRQAQQYFIEFGIDAKNPLPGIDLAAHEHKVRVDVLLGHKRRWTRLVTFALRAQDVDTPGAYLTYSNDAVGSD